MNTITTAIAQVKPIPCEQALGRSRLDPAMVTVVGCGAGSILALSAVLGVVCSPEAANLALGGNAALVLFAALSLDRPYRRFWAPSLFALACTGLCGLALALLPALALQPMQLAMVRFCLEGLLIIAQLGAMALIAMGWATAGRNPRHMRHAAACAGLLAAMILAQALHGSVDPGAATIWTNAIDLVFAIWLIRTAFCLLRPRFRA